MEENCKMFNRERYMGEYNATVELNSNLTAQNITGENARYIYCSWINNMNYNDIFCLPSTNTTSLECDYTLDK